MDTLFESIHNVFNWVITGAPGTYFLLFLVVTIGEVIAVAPLILEALYLTIGIQIAGNSDVPALALLFITLPATELGATFVYWLGRAGRTPIQRFILSLLRLRRGHVHIVQRWLRRTGPWPIAVGRMIPGLLIPVSFFAGVLHIPYRRFVTGVLIQSTAWAAVFIILGGGLRLLVGDVGPDVQNDLAAFKIGLFIIAFLAVASFLGYLRWGPKNEKGRKTRRSRRATRKGGRASPEQTSLPPER